MRFLVVPERLEMGMSVTGKGLGSFEAEVWQLEDDDSFLFRKLLDLGVLPKGANLDDFRIKQYDEAGWSVHSPDESTALMVYPDPEDSSSWDYLGESTAARTLLRKVAEARPYKEIISYISSMADSSVTTTGRYVGRGKAGELASNLVNYLLTRCQETERMYVEDIVSAWDAVHARNFPKDKYNAENEIKPQNILAALKREISFANSMRDRHVDKSRRSKKIKLVNNDFMYWEYVGSDQITTPS